MSDPEEAAVVVAANRIDIKYAEIAKKKSRNPDILNFAETMAKDHNAVITVSDYFCSIHVVMKGKLKVK